MAPRKKPPLAPETPLAAAQATLQKLLPEALKILGSAPVPSMPPGTTVAIPVGTGQTMIGALRTRPNWYVMPRRQIDPIARLVVERNWFARPVHHMRVGVYGFGFRFQSKAADDWAKAGSYPFARIQKDMIEEWCVSRSIVAWWRKEAPGGTFPEIHVPNSGDVHYEILAGIPQITITLPRHSKLDESLKESLGVRLWDCYKNGKKLVISKGDADFDFDVMKEGKSSAPLPVSPLIAIFDDLDFIEAVRVGDWNGAKARWEIIRHTKKGYNAATSGPNAGTKAGQAKIAELKAILKAMKEIYGKTDVATNFDQEIAWNIFPKEHFHQDLLMEVKQRLLMWSGVFGVLLLKTDSQITGLSAFMMDQLRAEVLAFRGEFTGFLAGIFQAGSFRAGIPNAPDLVPQWSVKPLYSGKALIELATAFQTYGIAAPQTIRGLFDIDDDAESDLMLQAHEDPKRYTPPFEPRQGIASFFTAPDSGGGGEKDAPPGEPGRPPTE